jgi:hypothetical protein
MYCDSCGKPFNPGIRYCSACGKQLLTGPAAPNAQAAAAGQPAVASRTSGDGRVLRNLNIVAGLWAASGILRLFGVAWWMIFRRIFFESGWPFGNLDHGFRSLLWGGIFSSGIFLSVFGVLHLLLAWGLYQRQPWARVLGIVLACFALIRIPFGTALGIYTLWVMAPESSGREYDEMAGTGARVNAPGYSR